MMDLTDLRYKTYSFFWKLIDIVFPPVCVGCGKNGENFCQECEPKIVKINRSVINGGRIFELETRYSTINDEGFEKSYSYHDGVIRKAIHRLKYEKDLGLGRDIGKFLEPIVRESNWDIDVIVPVPLGEKRKKDRGYNQSEIIAYPLANYLGIEIDSNLVKRCKETRTQIGLSTIQRYENMKGAFEVKNGKAKGKRFLLIDDVYTSGATIRSAEKALKEAGAACVYKLTVTKAKNISNQDIW